MRDANAGRYFLPRLGVCDRADAAAVFAAFDDFGLVRVFDAALAAFVLVCFLLAGMAAKPPVV